MADDPQVAAVALAVDLVEEYDGDDSYPQAVLDAAAATDVPVVVLTNVTSAVDQTWAGAAADVRRPGARGDAQRAARARPPPVAGGTAPDRCTTVVVDTERQRRWQDRLAAGPLDAVSSFALLRDYGIATVRVERATSRDGAVSVGGGAGRAGGAQDRRGCGAQVRGRRRPARPARTRTRSPPRTTTSRGGSVPRVLVCSTAPPGVELSVGLADDPLLGPLVVVGGGRRARRGAGGPRGGAAAAGRRAGRRGARTGCGSGRCWAASAEVPPRTRGLGPAAVVALGAIALELGDQVRELDVNPLVAGPAGAVAADVLVVPR